MPKIVQFGHDAHQSLEVGIDKLSRVVRVTLGPRAATVVLGTTSGLPVVTSDGASIAQVIQLDDPFENQGAEIVKEAVTRTAAAVGDGASTTTVLTHALVREGLRRVQAGADPAGLRRGIEWATAAAVRAIRTQARRVESTSTLALVAGLSAADPEVGQVVARALDPDVGLHGVVAVESSNTLGVTLDRVRGTRLEQGFLSPRFVVDPARRDVVLENPLVMVTDEIVGSTQQLLPVLELVVTAGRPLLLVAADVTGEALAMLASNAGRGTIGVVAVRAPGTGQAREAVLDDLAVTTGGRVLSRRTGLPLESTSLDLLGTAGRVVVTGDRTDILEGRGRAAETQGRVAAVQRMLAAATSAAERDRLEERIARLTGELAIIRVGAATEVELRERQRRVRAALAATRAAIAHGVVAGGGTALIRAQASVLEAAAGLGRDEAEGARVVASALEEPLYHIAENAGIAGSVAVERVATLGRHSPAGLNALTGEYEDLFEVGVLDPAKVTTTALEHAASVARLLLDTDAVLADQPAGRPPPPTRGRRPGRRPVRPGGPAPGARRQERQVDVALQNLDPRPAPPTGPGTAADGMVTRQTVLAAGGRYRVHLHVGRRTQDSLVVATRPRSIPCSPRAGQGTTSRSSATRWTSHP